MLRMGSKSQFNTRGWQRRVYTQPQTAGWRNRFLSECHDDGLWRLVKSAGPTMSAHDVMILAAHSFTVVCQCMLSSGTCNDPSHRHYTVMQRLSASKTVHWTVKIAPTMHQKSLFGDQKSKKKFRGRGTAAPQASKGCGVGRGDNPLPTSHPFGACGASTRLAPKPSHFPQTGGE